MSSVLKIENRNRTVGFGFDFKKLGSVFNGSISVIKSNEKIINILQDFKFINYNVLET